MAEQEHVMVPIPQAIVHELEGLAAVNKETRDQIIREALQSFLAQRKRHNIKEELREGYQQMGQLNKDLAESFLAAEKDAWER